MLLTSSYTSPPKHADFNIVLLRLFVYLFIEFYCLCTLFEFKLVDRNILRETDVNMNRRDFRIILI